MFSFNDPQGMCPECSGIGRSMCVDMSKAVDMSKSLQEGAIMLPGYGVDSFDWTMLVHSGPFDPGKKLSNYGEEELEQLLYGKARKVATQFGGKTMNITVEGVIEKFTNKYIKQDLKTKSERTQKPLRLTFPRAPAPAATVRDSVRLHLAAGSMDTTLQSFHPWR